MIVFFMPYFEFQGKFVCPKHMNKTYLTSLIVHYRSHFLVLEHVYYIMQFYYPDCHLSKNSLASDRLSSFVQKITIRKTNIANSVNINLKDIKIPLYYINTFKIMGTLNIPIYKDLSIFAIF